MNNRIKKQKNTRLCINVLLIAASLLGIKQVCQFAPIETISVASAFTDFLSEVETTQAPNERLRSSRAIYPKPPLPRLPRAGNKFTDPTFGTEIMRATDERDDKVGLSTYYSHWPTFNCNNTYMLLKKGLSGDALIKSFNSEFFTIGSGYQPERVNFPDK